MPPRPLPLRFLHSLLAALALVASLAAHAQLTIEIPTASGKQTPIAIAPFVGEVIAPESVTAVIGADLQRSGLFRLVDTSGIAPVSDPPQVQFAEWQRRQAEAIVIGSVNARPDGRYAVRFFLLETAKQQNLAAFEFVVPAVQLRATAHKIADIVYEKLTGEKGVFSTRIAYVVKRGNRYDLQVADWDGAGAQTILTQDEPIMSPSWSPDGSRLAYVSFETRNALVYVQELVSGQRRKIVNLNEQVSAPAWSADGNSLALSVWRNGAKHIFTMPIAGGELRQLTDGNSINTEPAFSPDGKTLFFMSDRGGGPQIYRVSVTGGMATRVTFEGGYNASPSVSPDGKQLAYLSRDGGRYRIAVLDIDSQQVTYLSDGPADERPSFAANGRTVLYAGQSGGRGTLHTVSIDGRVKQRLSAASGNVQEPAWGPIPR
jgi:TolB protein